MNFDQALGDRKFKNECPKCHSQNLDYDVIETQDEWVTQAVDCKDCECRFRIWSNLNWEYDEDSFKGEKL